MTIRVLIADDHDLVRTGFRMIIEAEDDLEVCGTAADGREAVDATSRLRPDVVLMDIQMPDVDGITATQRIASTAASTRVLILTTFERDDYIFDALRAGASGFLIKNAPPEQLIDAIRVIAAGDALLAPAVTRRIIAEFARHRPPSPAAVEHLTARERNVLDMLARGHTNAEIAAELHISAATTKTHVSNVLMKLDLRDRTHAVVYAYETGIVRPGQQRKHGDTR